MNTTRKAVAALVVLAVLAPTALEAQAATAGRRGAVTRPSRSVPESALHLRSVPVATPRRHDGIADHFGRAGRHPVHDLRFRSRGFAQRTVFVPYATTVVQTVATADAALLEAVEEARDAALDAREAALDAREAALDIRAATSGRAVGSAPPGSRTLTWKPGGITPADPEDAPSWNRSKVIMLESGGEPVIRPAADPGPPSFARYVAPATVVALQPRALSPWLVPLPDTPAPALVPWWAGTGCASLHQQAQERQQQDRRRFPWGLGWLSRYGRDVEVERGVVSAPSFYMRSPLLYGLYRRPDCPPEGEGEETCAEVTVVGDDDAEIAFDVPLPQLEARSPRALRDAIRAGLGDDETVVLRTTDGEEFDLMPTSVREVGAATCRVD